MSSKRSSRSKKTEASPKVKVSYKEANGTDEDTEPEEVKIDSANSEDEESSESDKPQKRRESSFNRAAFSMPDDLKKLMERVTCCSCGKQLNPMNPGAVRYHPWLKVVTCKKCYRFLRSGPFTRDDDGIDEQCRWCGDGGRLYGCDYCHNCFCRSCIKRNLGRSEAALMENDEDSKWHCYICKPKKIKKLVEDCDKVIRYVKDQEKKEKEKEERAKQREKQKCEERARQREKDRSEKLKEKSKKDKKEENDNKDKKEKKDGKDQKEETGTPKRGFPAPREKSQIADKLSVEKVKDTKPVMSVSQSEPDLIVLKDSPAKPLHHRAVNYRPDVKTGVQYVQKLTNNLTAVTVGPKNEKPVVNIMPKSYSQPRPPAQKPLLMGMLTSIPKGTAPSTNFNLERNIVKKLPPSNDIKALRNNVFPYNVEDVVEKLSSFTQSFGLSLNSIKTDLAIAKLSQSNMFQAKQMGCTQMRNGLEVYFNQIRELLNVQLIASYPQAANAADKSRGDATPLSSSSLTSTPKGGKLESLVNSLSGKLDTSAIPIEIDDPSPVKKVDKKEKMETDDDDDVVVMTDSDSKDVVVITDTDTKETKVLHIDKDEVVMEEMVNGEADKSEKSETLEENQDEVDQITIDEDDDGDESDKKTEHASRSKNKANSDDETDKNTEHASRSKKKANKEDNDDEIDKKRERGSRSKNKGNKTDENDDDESVKKSERSSNSKKTANKNDENLESDVQGKCDSVEESSDTEKETDQVQKVEENESEDSKSDDVNEINENESAEESSKNKMDDSENTAAELELLKEMADELNEQEDKLAEPRRSGRNKKPETSESKSESDRESPVKRSSRQRRKPEADIKENTDEKQEKSSPEKGKKGASNSKKLKEAGEDSEEDKGKDKASKKENKKSGDKEKKSPSKSSGGVKIDYDVKSDEEILDKKDIKKETKLSKSGSKKKDEVSDDETEEEVEDKKGKNSKETKSSKKQKKSDKDKNVSESETETEVVDKKIKSDDGKKKDSKKPIKSEVNDLDADDDDVPMEESDTTESSDESVEEFGKRKKKRKIAPKEETTTRQTRQRGKKEETNTENSDSDSEFDPDLEKEIKSLSKDTKLTRKKAKELKESKKESQSKKEKPKGKEEKKGKKNADKEDSDLSSGIEEASEVEENDSEDDTDTISASQLKKLQKAGKAVMEEESGDDRPDDFSDSSDDPEVSFPKLGSSKKGKKHNVDELSEDSDFMTPKKKKRVRSKLLDAKISDSESDTGKKGKKRGKKGAKKRKKEDSDAYSELSDEEENRKNGLKGKKRRRIKKLASSEEEGDDEPGANDDVGSDEEDDGTPGGFLKRKQIRRVIGTKKLKNETKAAQKAEEERRKRIEERQKEYNTYVEVEGGQSEDEALPEGTEREVTTPVKADKADPISKDGADAISKDGADAISKILGSPKKIPVTTKCVLEMDKEKKKPLVEVDRTLIKKLKPHQVEAVRFMYNCCVENISRLKKEEGSGCILAHCMGLGKTLSVITFVHTMLSNVKLTKMTKCLVVCPLNTILNWVNEFEIWLDDVDFEIEVYEMSAVKQNFERAQMLKEWHEGGAAVLIMGYDMYRNLTMGSHCKNKKQKKIFYETLADPGPDLVVCDEGHILKNDATSLSKAMTKIISRRRIVLTGTPLQNNLGEYHCMVNFVKPSLLGTRKEFNNRFCNPIINGQCSDSTQFDFKLMKRRAHILHELLAGCVQRKDYSALTKFLPPKFEYVISVRLSPVQMNLYEKYLEMNLGSDIRTKGARLFADYQALMRIWTHPWVLKLDEIRQENKRMLDDEDEDSFIGDSESDMDSFVDDSTTSSNSSSDDEGASSGSNLKKKKRRTRGNKDSSSSGDESKKEKPDEVVKKWTSKRRGNEEGAGSSWMEDMGYAQTPAGVTTEWWSEFVKEEDKYRLELGGKLVLMCEILRMCEDIGDKVLVFSQSILSLNIIEDFLSKIDEAGNQCYSQSSTDKPDNTTNEASSTDKPDNPTNESSSTDKPSTSQENGEVKEKTWEEKNNEKLSKYGKSWSKGLDYFRMDGSTSSQHRKASQDQFNDPENYRARLFLISTKAGSLGINLVAANRVIIFDASWNPSHDIQSIFRVYRFGQVKPVYVYRFLAQGTMEEKIYERQVTKQSLSQRVVDEHQIERHFTSADLQELYQFQPERLDDKEKTDKPLPILPKDHMLAELMTNNKEWIVKYHEHDSLLENVIEQELSEDEKKAAWEDYENEKKGLNNAMGGMQMNPGMMATQQMNMQNLLMQGQANLGQAAVLQIVQDLKARFPNLPPEVFQQRVQAVLRQVLTQQIMQQSELQRRQIEQQRMNELTRLNQIKQEIQRQQAMINNQQRVYGMGGSGLQIGLTNPGAQSLMPQGLRPQTMNQLQQHLRPSNYSDQQKK